MTTLGDAAASKRPPFEELVAAHVDLVYGAALRQVRDTHLADDVTQAVFLLVARRRDRLPAEGILAAWLVNVTRYTALTALRARRRRQLHESAGGVARVAEEGGADATRSSVEAAAIERENSIGALLDESLMALAESDRRLIVLRYLQNRPLNEVAMLLRLKTNTAAKRAERALERMRRYFARRGVDVTGSMLGAGLASQALKRAPATMAGEVMRRAAAMGASAAKISVPLGVVLMAASMKTKVALGVAAVVLLAVGSYVAIRAVLPVGGTSSGTAATAVAAGPAAEVDGYVELDGTVNGPDGKPVVGALVTQGYTPYLAEGYVTTRTDVNGNFYLSAKTGEELDLAVQASGFAPELIKAPTILSEQGKYSFTLKPAKTLRIRVIDERGKPVPSLILDPMQWRKTEVLRTRGFRNGPRTDADGIYVWKDAPEDAVTWAPVSSKEYLQKSFTLTASEELQTVTLRDAIKAAITAVDGDTNVPLPEFKVVYGRGFDAAGPNLWEDSQPHEGSNGSYDTTITYSFPYHFYRVEAPGYPPMVQRMDESQDATTLNFRLSKAAGRIATIVKPDGNAAAGATVYLMPQGQHLSLHETALFHDGRAVGNGGYTVLQADSEGKVNVPQGSAGVWSASQPARTRPSSPSTGPRLVILDEDGYADVTVAAALASKVALAAWARVEGTAFVGKTPLANGVIELQTFVQQPDWGAFGQFEAETDADGNFVFPRVPPTTGFVGRRLEADKGAFIGHGSMVHALRMDLAPGKTVKVAIGGKGRPVIGHLATSDGSPLPSAWGYSYGELEEVPGPMTMPAPTPSMEEMREKLKGLSEDEAKKEVAEYMARPGVAEYFRALSERDKNLRDYEFVTARDGTFRIDDVESENYGISIRVVDLKNGATVGTVTGKCEVTEGRQEDAVDMGELVVKPGMQ